MTQADLFERDDAASLAERLRPRSLDQVLGQDAVLGRGSPLRRLVDEGAHLSVLLWGPPGTGKTTLALLMSSASGRRFVALSALNSGVKELRTAITEAHDRLMLHGERTLLFIDEIHRFSKNQQDILLEGVEKRWVALVGATTENPSFSVVSALLSRSLLVALAPLGPEALTDLLERACQDPRGLGGAVSLTSGARELLVRRAQGDARRALTALEACAGAVGTGVVDVDVAERVMGAPSVRYDASGDQHYDVTSALIKSVRGGDVDAALHYLARMVAAGEDPRFIARRLVILASEDIGVADASALGVAVNAARAVELVGMPEGRYALAQAVVHLALSPKSNAVNQAFAAALGDVESGRVGPVPDHLRDGHGPEGPRAYLYPHDFPGGVVAQEHMPEVLRGREYYAPKPLGFEAKARERLEWLRQRLRGGS